MSSRATKGLCAVLLAAVVLLLAATGAQAEEQKLHIGGTVYMKYLWGTARLDGSLYNFTTIPSEGYGDNGQGTELELLVSAKVSSAVEISGRLKARFNQNQWTNFGGFGNPAGGVGGSGVCVGGDCGEIDPRSAQYVKFRGMQVRLTPGYKWVDAIAIGSNDFGMFDPFTIGKIRYIDRDNGAGILFQGSAAGRKFSYDVVRISLPRLWAGPNFNTGDYTGADAAWGGQFKVTPSSKVDFTGSYTYVNDIEVDSTDRNLDNGRALRTRFRNGVASLKLGFHPNPTFDVAAAVYDSTTDSIAGLAGAPGSFFGISGFSPVPAGSLSDQAYKLDLNINDPWSNGLSFNLEYFDIGSDYVSMMAARRESDVLLTEGHDGAFAFPGPDNSAFGVFAGNPTRIGYGGWQGNAQQVATINVDNEFTDFEEPMAETVIGWKGFTIQPVYGTGSLDLSAEYTKVDYNTNWQAWGDPSRPILDTIYPNHESDAGIGSFRNAYAPFQDRKTDILVLKGKYFVDVGKGIELFGKIKYIDETDKRMNSARFLPYAAGDCGPSGSGCAGVRNEYSAGNSTADLYGNPPVITNSLGETGYQWKPFDSLSDDDKDMNYKMYQAGAGYQLTDDLYGSLTYEYYDVDLKDGNTAFQAYQLHSMASGKHTKNKVMLTGRYVLAGVEMGMHYEYNFGSFDPDFGDGFVVQYADESTSANVNVPVNSPGFSGRFGGWNSLLKRNFDQNRFKLWMKVQF